MADCTFTSGFVEFTFVDREFTFVDSEFAIGGLEFAIGSERLRAMIVTFQSLI